jgi:hypothetical protein
MDSDRLNRWLTLGANFGVLGGLVLVLLQMNQNEELLRVQVTNDFYESYIAAETTFSGENLPAIWQKSLEDPENLSIAEMRAMEAQTFSPLTRWINLYRLAEAGIFDGEFWRTQIELDVSYYLGSQYGRAWWEYYSEAFPASYLPVELKDQIDKELAEASVDSALTQYREIQRIIKRNKTSSLAE